MYEMSGDKGSVVGAGISQTIHWKPYAERFNYVTPLDDKFPFFRCNYKTNGRFNSSGSLATDKLRSCKVIPRTRQDFVEVGIFFVSPTRGGQSRS